MSPRSSDSSADPLRPADHVDGAEAPRSGNPKLGFVGWLRFLWRQLTSMRTAIVLLLLLALGAIPGSLVPQRSSDPNGVIQVRANNPDLVPLYDALSLHDVYASPWFSAIYILLFVSLIGCVIPRTMHHVRALRQQPPKTPARLSRLTGFQTIAGTAADIDRAARILRRLGYRTVRYGDSVSAERGYLRETGNLVFHASLIAVLVAVALGGGWSYSGQRLVIEGQAYASSLSSYDVFSPGRWFSGDLPAYSVALDDLAVEYETQNANAIGAPLDFTARVTVTDEEGSRTEQIKVNEPIRVQGEDLFLISNGYAPVVRVTNAAGETVFDEPVPFLAQDDKLTSLGVIHLPQGLAEQVGLRGFFYPTAVTLESGALASGYPDVLQPVMTLQVYTGDLGLDTGVPSSVYKLNTDGLTQIAGGDSGTDALMLVPGEPVALPNGLGTITMDDVRRYAVIDMKHDPTQGWVLGSVVVLIAALITSLLVPRRRVWVKATDAGLELAGLARGEDPGLERAVGDVAKRLREAGADAPPGEPDR